MFEVLNSVCFPQTCTFMHVHVHCTFKGARAQKIGLKSTYLKI